MQLFHYQAVDYFMSLVNGCDKGEECISSNHLEVSGEQRLFKNSSRTLSSILGNGKSFNDT